MYKVDTANPHRGTLTCIPGSNQVYLTVYYPVIMESIPQVSGIQPSVAKKRRLDRGTSVAARAEAVTRPVGPPVGPPVAPSMVTSIATPATVITGASIVSAPSASDAPFLPPPGSQFEIKKAEIPTIENLRDGSINQTPKPVANENSISRLECNLNMDSFISPTIHWSPVKNLLDELSPFKAPQTTASPFMDLFVDSSTPFRPKRQREAHL